MCEMAGVVPDDTSAPTDPPPHATIPASTIHCQNSRSLWTSGPRHTRWLDRSLDDKTPESEETGKLACASSLRTKRFPGRTATDTCNKKPVNADVCLRVAKLRDGGKFVKSCWSLWLLWDSREVINLSVSRTHPSTSKHVLHRKSVCVSSSGGFSCPRGPRNRK